MWPTTKAWISQAKCSTSRAHRAADAGVTNLTFRQAALEDLDATGNFDAVLALSLLHLLEDRDAGIAHVAEMLETRRVVHFQHRLHRWHKWAG